MMHLDGYLTVARFLPQLFAKTDIAVFATDREKFLIFDKHGQFKIDIKPGDALKPGGTPALVLQQGKAISRYVPREVYGVICRTVCIPVEGGTIGVAFSIENEEEVRLALESANSTINQLEVSSSSITENAEAVVDFMKNLASSMNATKSQLEEINSVGKLIGNIAEDTRFISLNALIEATRAGTHGHTFAVVAKEMQELSHQTRRSIQSVDTTLATIHQHFRKLDDELSQVRDNIKGQSVANREIHVAIQEMSRSLASLNELSKQL